jgi:phosphoserine phosphatase
MRSEFLPGLMIQRLTPPLKVTDFKLIAFDMDSTLINIECIDEMAEAVGKKAAVARITEAAMQGESLDFADSLRQRMALLKGMPRQALEDIAQKRLQLNPGADILVKAALRHGWHTLLVSGGFTYFANQVQKRLHIHEAYANELAFDAQNNLTGEVRGPIIDGQAKKQHVLNLCKRLGIAAHQAIAVGDGANDLPMMEAAGLSVAYHAKPKVREQAMVSIEKGGLDRLLALFKPTPFITD